MINISLDMERIKAFCARWQVKEFYLFGSVLRDDFDDDSDVDVLIKLLSYSTISLFDWMDMQDELETIIGKKVDLVSADGVRNPFIRYEIAQSRRLIYAA